MGNVYIKQQVQFPFSKNNSIDMISIIVPVYNVEGFIEKCLNSVTCQTYNGDIECIVVDDCGDDNSINIAESFIQSSNSKVEFRLIHHAENKGLSAARNTGIRESKGEWIYFLDSDDWIEPDCIERLYSYVEKYPDVQMVQAGANVHRGRIGYMDFTKKHLPEYANNREWISKALLQRFTLSMTAWNKLLRKDYLSANNLSFAEGFIHEDEIFNIDLARTLERIAICPVNTYNLLVRVNSITKYRYRDDTKARFTRLMKVWLEMEKHFEDRIASDASKMIIYYFHGQFYNNPKDVSATFLNRFSQNFNWKNSSFLKAYVLLFPIKGIRRIDKSIIRSFLIRNQVRPVI